MSQKQSKIIINYLTEDNNGLKLMSPPSKKQGKTRICFISDTHETHRSIKIPECDILIHTGDILMTNRYRSRETSIEKIKDFLNWCNHLPVRKKIILLGGNHDYILEKDKNIITRCQQNRNDKIIYLENSVVKIDNFNYVGTPYSSGVSGNNAFQSAEFKTKTDKFIQEVKKKNLRNIILLTHGPPLKNNDPYQKALDPVFHLYGHVHQQYGLTLYENIIGMNGTTVDIRYNPINKPIVFDIPHGTANVLQVQQHQIQKINKTSPEIRIGENI